MRKLCLATLFVLALAVSGRAQVVPYSDIVLTSRGTPAGGASVAVCGSPGLATTGATVTSNIAILTMSSNPVTAGFVANMSLSVAGFTGADTYFNGSFTILTVTSTTITYALTHANGSASSNGTAFQTGNSSTSCAPLSSIFSDAGGLVPITQPGFTADGLGNYQFYAASGTYNIQFYGPVLTVRVKAATLGCAGGGCSVTSLTVSGAATLNGTTLNCIANGVYYVNPGCFSGSDVGAQVNSAFTACHSGTIVTAYCKVVIPYVPAGYIYTTTINLPVVTNVTLVTLEIESGTYLQYNGVGDAIAATVGAGGASNPNIQIIGYGANLAAGNVHQGTGIHFKGITSSNIFGLTVAGFQNNYFCDGSNSGNLYGTVLTQGLVNWRSKFETINGAPSACNNNSFHGGSIIGAAIWGVMDDATNQTASQATFNTHNTFFGTTIEGNGVTSSAVNISTCSLSTGIVTLTTSTNINASVDGVVWISGSATGNGYFKILTSNGTNQLTYASSTNCTNSSGTARYYTGNAFMEGGDSYLFSGVWFETQGAPMPSLALVGDTNTISNHDDFNDDTSGDNNATSAVDNVNGQGTLLIGFRIPYATITNLVNNGAAATGLYIEEPRGSFTNTCAGTCTSATISMTKDITGLNVYNPGGYGLNGDTFLCRSAAGIFAVSTAAACANASGFLLFSGARILASSNNGEDLGFSTPGIYTGGSTAVRAWSSGLPTAGPDTGLSRDAAGVVDVGTGAQGNKGGSLKLSSVVSAGTAAVLSGTGACATITTQTGGASAGSAKCTGTTGASTLTITFALTAPTGWVCDVWDETTRANIFQQTSHTATTCVLTVTSVTSGDVFVFKALGF